MKQVFARHVFAALSIVAAWATYPVCAVADHAWGTYHWARTGSSFTLQLGDNVSPSWEPYLWTASTQWSNSSVLATTIVPGGTRPRTCKPTSGRVEVCSEKYGFNGWLGIAQIWLSGSHITQGTTKLNDSYFSTAKYDTPGWRNLVTCQEVGHTFGLDHQDENFSNPNLGSCMDYTSNPAGPPSNEYPNAHDYEQLATIYAHLDAGTTVAQTTQSGRAPPSNEADDPSEIGTAQWGRLVRSTNGGRTEIFEQDLGGGRKKFTFVIWADPEDQPGRGRR